MDGQAFTTSRASSGNGSAGETKDEGDGVLVLQCKQNNRGRFMEILATPREGRGRYILVPEDRNASGWENLAWTLQSEFLEDKSLKIQQAFKQNPQDFPPHPGMKKVPLPSQAWIRKNQQEEWALAICVEKIDADRPWEEVDELVALPCSDNSGFKRSLLR